MRQRDVMRNHFNLPTQANDSQSKNPVLYPSQKTPSYEAASGIALHSILINAVERGLSEH